MVRLSLRALVVVTMGVASMVIASLGGCASKSEPTGGPEGGTSSGCLTDTPAAAPPACPGSCAPQCATLNANLKKGVAADALHNLTAAVCQADTANSVASASGAKACADATSKAFCDGLATGGCTAANNFPNFAADCLTLAHALSGTGVGADATLGRKALFECINGDPKRDCSTCQAFVTGKLN